MQQTFHFQFRRRFFIHCRNSCGQLLRLCSAKFHFPRQCTFKLIHRPDSECDVEKDKKHAKRQQKAFFPEFQSCFRFLFHHLISSLYPILNTVLIVLCRSSFFRKRCTWMSTVRKSPSNPGSHASSNSCCRERTLFLCSAKAFSSSNSRALRSISCFPRETLQVCRSCCEYSFLKSGMTHPEL